MISPSSAAVPPALELRQIVKRFPGVIANDHVSFAVEAGEIHALIGENGAGKTTLMNILYGLYQPDEGEIFIGGQRQRFHSPLEAIRAGLGMVHQHFMLFPSLTVMENIIYGSEPGSLGWIDRRTAIERVDSLSRRYGLAVEPEARIEDLPVGVCQRVEILKMLYRGAEILILDEPTAVLTPQERRGLFTVLRELAADGKAIVFITHKLAEVLALSHSATALRDGRVTGRVVTAHTDERELCQLMVGRDVELRVDKGPPTVAKNPSLRIEGLTVRSANGTEAVSDIDLVVRGGEIVGLAGAAGNGQRELVEAIAGLRPIAAGSIELEGEDVTAKGVRERRAIGQCHVPEDRDDVGLALAASLTDNLLLGFEDSSDLGRRGILDRAAIQRHSKTLLDRHDVKRASSNETAGNLSGGNRQKLVLARELAHKARLLLVEQPTRGVDIGATEQIYRRLIDYRDRGHAILLVSTDLTEILGLADRILVLFEGRIVGEIAASDASEERVGRLMGGGSDR